MIAAHQFVLTATSSSTQSSTRVSLTVNSPPSAGYAEVTPLSGVALNSTFTITALSWTDDSSVRLRAAVVLPKRGPARARRAPHALAGSPSVGLFARRSFHSCALWLRAGVCVAKHDLCVRGGGGGPCGWVAHHPTPPSPEHTRTHTHTLTLPFLLRCHAFRQSALSYRFSYTIGSREEFLSSRFQESGTMSGFSLPQGAGPTSVVFLAVIVRDRCGPVEHPRPAPPRPSPPLVPCVSRSSLFAPPRFPSPPPSPSPSPSYPHLHLVGPLHVVFVRLAPHALLCAASAPKPGPPTAPTS